MAATPIASSSTNALFCASPRTSNLAGAAPLALRWNYHLLAHAPWGVSQGQESGRGRARRTGPHGREVCPCARSPRGCLHDFTHKKEDALRLGADEVVVSRNADEMQKHAGSFDFILDAVSADHDINAYIKLLRRDGNLTLVGAPAKPLAVAAFGLSIRTPQPLRLAHRRHPRNPGDARFCGAHNITADVEVIPIQKVNEAYERLLKSDVKYRFSIDMASLKSE